MAEWRRPRNARNLAAAASCEYENPTFPYAVSALGTNRLTDAPQAIPTLRLFLTRSGTSYSCKKHMRNSTFRMANASALDQRMVPVFMPSLLTLFREAEQKSGSPLTFDEAKQIRNEALGVLVTQEVATKIETRRGFRDLDPINFWNDWQELRDPKKIA
jgi:hypothetical protein